MNFREEQYFLDYNNQLFNFIDFNQVFNQANDDYDDYLIKNNLKTTNLIYLIYEKNKGFSWRHILDFHSPLCSYDDVVKIIQNHPFMLPNDFRNNQMNILPNRMNMGKAIKNQDWMLHLDFLTLLFKFDPKYSKKPLNIEVWYFSYEYRLSLILSHDKRYEETYNLSFKNNLNLKETVITIVQFMLSKIIEFSYPNENKDKQKELKSEYIERLGLQDFFK